MLTYRSLLTAASRTESAVLMASEVQLQGSPSRRTGHTTVAVPWSGSKALLVFGGYDGSVVRNDTHMFHAGKWTRLTAAGPPAPRALHAAAVLAGGVVIVFGGWGGEDVLRSDTCALNLTQNYWQVPCPQALTPGPTARQGHSMVAVGGASATELVLFGGDTGGDVSSELWALSWSPSMRNTGEYTGEYVWQLLSGAGEAPEARSGHAVCMLSAPNDGGEQMLVSGGLSADGSCLADVHLFDVCQLRWSTPRLSGDVPRPRWAAACCVLPEGGPQGGVRVLIDGGRSHDGWIDDRLLIDVVLGDEGEEVEVAATPTGELATLGNSALAPTSNPHPHPNPRQRPRPRPRPHPHPHPRPHPHSHLSPLTSHLSPLTSHLSPYLPPSPRCDRTARQSCPCPERGVQLLTGERRRGCRGREGRGGGRIDDRRRHGRLPCPPHSCAWPTRAHLSAVG